MQRRGFTLVEIAMVLVIMGFIIMAIFPALTAVRTSTQRSVTQSHLKALMLATAAYVQANGCLPCPMLPGATGIGYGRVGGNSNPALPACVSCMNAGAPIQGPPPYISLGIQESTAHDGWGHWITMAVDPALTSGFTIAVPPQGSSGLCGSSFSKTYRLGIQTTNGNAPPPPEQAAVVFISHGSTGYGAFIESATPDELNGNRLTFPTALATCPNGGTAACNAKSGTTTFYDAPPVYGGAYAYDDILA